MDDLMRWAKDDLRSFNGQIEWILRDALRQKRRKALIDATPQFNPPPAKSKKRTSGEPGACDVETDGSGQEQRNPHP